jgi:hypothetical protein
MNEREDLFSIPNESFDLKTAAMKAMQVALAALMRWIRPQSRVANSSISQPFLTSLASQPMTKTQAEEILDWLEANGLPPANVQLTAQGFVCTKPGP